MSKLVLNPVEKRELEAKILNYTEKGTNNVKQVATYSVNVFGIDVPLKAYDITGAKLLEKYYFNKVEEEKKGD